MNTQTKKKKKSSSRQEAQRVNAQKIRQRKKEEEEQLEAESRSLKRTNVVLKEMLAYVEQVQQGASSEEAYEAAVVLPEPARHQYNAAPNQQSKEHLETTAKRMKPSQNEASESHISSATGSVASSCRHGESSASNAASSSHGGRARKYTYQVCKVSRRGEYVSESKSSRDSYDLFCAICSSSKIPRFFMSRDIPSKLPFYCLPGTMRNEVSEDSGNGGTLTLLGSDYDLLATIESQERYYFITSPHQRDNFKVVYFSSPLRELLGLPETGQGPWSYHNFFAEENDNPVLDHLEQALLFGYECHAVVRCRGYHSDSFWSGVLAIPLSDKFGKLAHWVFVFRLLSSEYAHSYRSAQLKTLYNSSELVDSSAEIESSTRMDCLPLWSSRNRDPGKGTSGSTAVEGIIEQNRQVQLENDLQRNMETE